MSGNGVPAATDGEGGATPSLNKDDHNISIDVEPLPQRSPAAGTGTQLTSPAAADPGTPNTGTPNTGTPNTGTPTSPDAVVTATNYATRLAYYMPTGTTTTFVVLSKAILEDGRCHAKPHNGEVAMMALLTSILGIFCFLSSFLKPVQQTNADGSVTTRSVLIPLDDIKRRKGDVKGKKGGKAQPPGPGSPAQGATAGVASPAEPAPLQRNRNGYSGWPLWVHALVSTMAFMAFALTSPECTSCFFYLPKAVGQGVPILVALIAGIIFGFLPNPEPDQKVEKKSQMAAPGPSSPVGVSVAGGQAGVSSA